MSASQIGVCAAKISRRNAAADSLSIRFADSSATDVFSAGDTVELFEDSTRRFYGIVSKLPTRWNGSAKNSEMLVESPWADMDKIVYQQLWKSANTASGEVVLSPVMRSKVVLGQNSSGEKIGVAAQVSDILVYAISCGAQFRIGTVSASANMLLDEARDLSCAEALARTLKWIPNAVAFFDYSGDGLPVLNIYANSVASAVEISADSGSVANISVTPRPDLALCGVSIKYERDNTSGDFSWVSVEEDNYSAGFNSAAKNALVMSVELDGDKASVQTYDVLTETVQASSPDWWRAHIPALSSAADFLVLSTSRTDGTYERELVSGTVPSRSGYLTAADKVSADVSYTDADGSLVERSIAVNIVTINAPSGTLHVWNATQASEAKPVGLAQAIYEASLGLRFEGSMRIIGGKCESFFCKKLNIGGGKSEWASMNSVVVSCNEDLFGGILSLKFGPPKHLYPADIAELFRIARDRKVSTDWWARSTGKRAAASVSLDGDSSAVNGSNGDARYAKFVVSGGASYGRAELSSRDLSSGQVAKFREVAVCVGGRSGVAKILMTEPDFS